VSVEDLKRGPGHYPGSPLPGRAGNASVAGHRTTYGAPFHRIDELVSGDEIIVTSLQGVSRYSVIQQLVVRPDQVEVLGNYGDNRLTLTACHPKYSAAERLVVIAKLQKEDGDDVPEAPDPDVAAADVTLADLDGGLSGESASVWPVAALGVACALIWFGAWVMARFVKPVIAYAIGTPLFLVVLFVFYENVARLLPANF
jgi:sortase A